MPVNLSRGGTQDASPPYSFAVLSSPLVTLFFFSGVAKTLGAKLIFPEYLASLQPGRAVEEAEVKFSAVLSVRAICLLSLYPFFCSRCA